MLYVEDDIDMQMQKREVTRIIIMCDTIVSINFCQKKKESGVGGMKSNETIFLCLGLVLIKLSF